MKQTKKIKILLVAALGGLSVMGYAQGKVCEGTTYEIQELQAPSDPSVYQWLEDGNEIPGAAAAGYTVPSGKAVGKYTYVRRSKKEGCDWASSNAYTVEVISCAALDGSSVVGATGSFQDPRDQKVYKTVKMPDGNVWFAENLNYQKDLTFNQQATQANGIQFIGKPNGVDAIGSYWCPAANGATLSADRNTCNIYGALYTWETAMSEDGKGDWNESAVSGNYFNISNTPASSQAQVNNAKGDGQRGICPPGWHVPTINEWAVLLDAVDPSPNTFTTQVDYAWNGTDVAAQLMSARTYTITEPGDGSWEHCQVCPQVNERDKVNFSVLPSGHRNSTPAFAGRGTLTALMSSSASSNGAFYDILITSLNYQPMLTIASRQTGTIVRCMKLGT